MSSPSNLTPEERERIADVYKTHARHARWACLSLLSAGLVASLAAGLVAPGNTGVAAGAGFLAGLTLPSGLEGDGNLALRALLMPLKGALRIVPRFQLALREVRSGHRYLKAHFVDR